MLGHALFSDQSQITIRMISRDEAPIDEAFWRGRLASRDPFPRDAGDQRHGVPARARRSRPAAVADRRSLWRLPRDANAVAGDGSPGADADAAARRAHRRQGRARAQRSEGAPARRARAESRSAARHGARDHHRPRSGRDLHGRSVARTEDRLVSRSTREPRGRRALRARAAARLLQLQRRVRAGARAEVRHASKRWTSRRMRWRASPPTPRPTG